MKHHYLILTSLVVIIAGLALSSGQSASQTVQQRGLGLVLLAGEAGYGVYLPIVLRAGQGSSPTDVPTATEMPPSPTSSPTSPSSTPTLSPTPQATLTSTPTGTETLPPTATRTPSPTATRTPTPTSTTIAGYIANGDFEQGPDVGWQQYQYCREPSECPYPRQLIVQGLAFDDPVYPTSGQWLAALKVREFGEAVQIYQTVNLPSNTTLYLNFSVLTHSTESCEVGLYDQFTIWANREPICPWFDHYQLCWSDNTNQWAPITIGPFSLAEGGAVLLAFELWASPADYGLTTVFLDDISVDPFPRAEPRCAP